MIKNIGAYLSNLQAYIAGKTAISTIFSTRIYAGKPITPPGTGAYMYFQLLNNSELTGDDRSGTTKKKALFEFYLVANDKATPDEDLYTWLDAVSNALVTIGGDDDAITLGALKAHSIDEGQQSGVLRETDENPYIIAQYHISYKSLY